MRDDSDTQIDKETQCQQRGDSCGASLSHCGVLQGILLDRADKLTTMMRFQNDLSQKLEEAMVHNDCRGTEFTCIPGALQSCIDIREQTRESFIFFSNDALNEDERNVCLVSRQNVSKNIVFRSLVEKNLFKKTGDKFSLFGTKHIRN